MNDGIRIRRFNCFGRLPSPIIHPEQQSEFWRIRLLRDFADVRQRVGIRGEFSGGLANAAGCDRRDVGQAVLGGVAGQTPLGLARLPACLALFQSIGWVPGDNLATSHGSPDKDSESEF
jgi:hypothetical protein